VPDNRLEEARVKKFYTISENTKKVTQKKEKENKKAGFSFLPRSLFGKAASRSSNAAKKSPESDETRGRP
jgi:hypothetical protein